MQLVDDVYAISKPYPQLALLSKKIRNEVLTCQCMVELNRDLPDQFLVDRVRNSINRFTDYFPEVFPDVIKQMLDLVNSKSF